MIIKIENEFLTAEINEFGAELYSLKGKKTDTEYLWQGNPEFWKSRSTVLFPICGRLYEGKYIFNEKEYEMPLHGIAKLFNFESEKVSPIQYRKLLKNTNKNDKDTILCSMISHMSILDGIDVDNLTECEDIPFYDVAMPDETYAFLHEAAIISFKNKLFAAWYNN